MIIALQLGRGGSVGFPGKNTHKIMGRAMMEYPLLAAKNSKYIDEIYVSTDSAEIKDIAKKNSVNVIDRPDYLCTKEALHEDAMVHGYRYVREKIREKIELIVLLQCNGPFVLSTYIDEGIEKLREDSSFDSAVTVSKYNMYSPTRARRVDADGTIHSFIPLEVFLDTSKITCDKDSQEDVYYADGLFIVRPKCLEHIEEGMLPYRWMGQKSYAIKNWGAFDVDYAWQVPQVEYWLKENGFSDNKTPYPAKSCDISKNGIKETLKDGKFDKCQKITTGGGNIWVYIWNMANDWQYIDFRNPVPVRFRVGRDRSRTHRNFNQRCA